jgi:hypothetical protein
MGLNDILQLWTEFHGIEQKKNIFYCYEWFQLLANWQISFNRQNLIPNEMNENEM